ncbi:hypothetical protein F2Q69_00006783 [Brassica cretica]|uniref:Uncharacterized protein n=1 Tax=Brassica cretica TaxID=69181 RepID=A0A8S9NYS8_BRACR|nr:hypothetical protein F2Q69_00006783 [Brassica cretica]
MEGSPYRKFSFSRGKGAGTQRSASFLSAGTQRSASCPRSGGIQYLSIFPQQYAPYSRFRHRTRGITCALKSTGVAHSQQASLRQDIAQVILRSRVQLRPEPHSEPGGGPVPFLQTGIEEKDAVSGVSIDSSSEEAEGSECDLMAPLSLSCAYAAPPLVGPASSVGEDEMAEWRSRYSLPSSVILRIPTPEEHASSYIPGEIAVYEAFFDSGHRGTIPALIAGLCKLFEISPSQLNPPPWRILIAIQNSGDLEYLSLGINEAARTHHAPSEGERAVLRARQLPVARRQVNFLVSKTVLRRSSLWRDMLGGVTNNPTAAYQEAVKVMSATKRSSSRSASGDEVMITGSRRSTVVKLETSPFLPGKRPKSGGVTTRSAQQTADMARSAGSLAVALSNLNLNVFPQDGTVFPIGDPSEVVQVLQGGLLRTVSQLYHLGERLSSEDLPTLREEIEDLKRQTSSADALTTSQKNQELGEEIDVLKAAAETFKFEMVMAANGARVVARWELMREWLRKQSAQWDLAMALEQYKAVVREEARNKGVLPPTFEDKPAIPPISEMDVDSSVKPRGSPA